LAHNGYFGKIGDSAAKSPYASNMATLKNKEIMPRRGNAEPAAHILQQRDVSGIKSGDELS
jgi:hypothetical protein